MNIREGRMNDREEQKEEQEGEEEMTLMMERRKSEGKEGEDWRL